MVTVRGWEFREGTRLLRQQELLHISRKDDNYLVPGMGYKVYGSLLPILIQAAGRLGLLCEGERFRKEHDSCAKLDASFVLNRMPQIFKLPEIWRGSNGSALWYELHYENSLTIPEDSAHNLKVRERLLEFFAC